MMGRAKNTLPKKFGRYEVIQVLASGAMGSVYIAKDPVLSRLVAIKVLHPHLLAHKAMIKRFFQEATTVAQLRSPFIVEVHDFGKEGDSPYLVMELVDGLSLDGVFHQLAYEPMDPVVAAALMCQAAEGLEVAAQKGIVHRDIKPDNLLISPKGYLKIADFGIAHVMDQAGTKTGAIIGTAPFMSPEQADGVKGITSQSDLFSLGSVFYYCLSGRAPFRAESSAGTIKKIVFEPHAPLLSVSPTTDPLLGFIVETLLQKDPLKRGAGATWLKTELKRYLLTRKVLDPVERIKAYLDELMGRGIQTTGFVSPSVIDAALRSRELQAAVPQPKGRRALVFVSGLVFVVLAATLAMMWKPGIDWRDGIPHWEKSSPSLKAQLEVQPSAPEPALPNATPPTPTALEAPVTGSDISPTKVLREPVAKPFHKTPKENRVQPPVQGAFESSTVSIASQPPFADVTLDGKAFGTTPIDQAPTTSGHHKLSLVDPNGTVRLDTVLDLRPGPQRFRFVLPPR